MMPTCDTSVNIKSVSDPDVDAANLHGTEKENDCYNDNLFTVDQLKETLHPLYISLRCFGLAYEGVCQSANGRLNLVEPARENPSDMDKERKDESRSQMKLNPKCNIAKCYCFFISVLMWFQLIVSSKNFFASESLLDVMKAFTPFGWMLLCALQQSIFFHVNGTKQEYKLSKFGQFLKEMGFVKTDDFSDTKRRIKVIVIISWVALFVNVVTVFVIFFQTDIYNASGENKVREIILGKWSKESMDIITYLYLPIHALLTGIWFFSTANYVALCVLVAKRFDDVLHRTTTVISLKQNINFASLRREHVQLCHVVSALDNMLSLSVLVSYAISIPLTCILLNVCILTYDVLSLIERVTYIFWIVATMTILIISSVAGALVNHKAYGLSEVIYDIDAKDLDSKSETELMLLISNLNSNSAGLTVGGLTTITKGMILTVFGTIIGYFTILIQFK